MKVAVAMDSFKGSLSTYEAGNAVLLGIKRVFPSADVFLFPIADGGEGSSEVIVGANQGEWKKARVKGPLGRRIEAQYGILRNKKLAIIEIAAAAGITLITEEERNPMHTTTYGVGELIKDAIDEGCNNFVVGLGGSATNDGGVGMLSALGYEFLDENGTPVPFGAEGLSKIKEIKTDNVIPAIQECKFLVACDVQNPLCGKNGCSAVYGPQKGADEKTVAVMDEGMRHFEKMTKTLFPQSDSDIPGSGAAGGLGFAFTHYLQGKLQSGIELILSQIGLEEVVRDMDIVVTGEGRLDGQSQMGKVPVGVAKLAKKYGKTVLSLSGGVTDDAKLCNQWGIDAFFPILKTPCSLKEAMENASKNLADTTEQVFRLIYQFYK